MNTSRSADPLPGNAEGEEIVHAIKTTIYRRRMPEVTPGGKALRFYASIRLKTFPMKPSVDVPNAGIMRIKVVKNKTSSPTTQESIFDFIYGRGPDPVIDLINCCKNLGILQFAGKGVKVHWPGGETEALSIGGRLGLMAALRSDVELFQKFYKACMLASVSKKENLDELTTDVDLESTEPAE